MTEQTRDSADQSRAERYSADATAPAAAGWHRTIEVIREVISGRYLPVIPADKSHHIHD
jgi:hypothetical protein